MNITDLINGIFEFLGFIFIIPSIIDLYKNKEVKGLNWITLSFFTFWSLWNMIFYPSNGLIVSFICGIFLSLSNLVWFIMTIYYSKFYKK